MYGLKYRCALVQADLLWGESLLTDYNHCYKQYAEYFLLDRWKVVHQCHRLLGVLPHPLHPLLPRGAHLPVVNNQVVGRR